MNTIRQPGPRRPDCPPWCTTDHAKYESCKSAHDHIDTPGGSLTAFTVRTTGPRAEVVHLQAHPSAEGACAAWLTARDAEELAGVVEVLAAATPDQHRELAGQLRAAVAALKEAGR